MKDTKSKILKDKKNHIKLLVRNAECEKIKEIYGKKMLIKSYSFIGKHVWDWEILWNTFENYKKEQADFIIKKRKKPKIEDKRSNMNLVNYKSNSKNIIDLTKDCSPNAYHEGDNNSYEQFHIIDNDKYNLDYFNEIEVPSYELFQESKNITSNGNDYYTERTKINFTEMNKINKNNGFSNININKNGNLLDTIGMQHAEFAASYRNKSANEGNQNITTDIIQRSSVIMYEPKMKEATIDHKNIKNLGLDELSCNHMIKRYSTGSADEAKMSTPSFSAFKTYQPNDLELSPNTLQMEIEEAKEILEDDAYAHSYHSRKLTPRKNKVYTNVPGTIAASCFDNRIACKITPNDPFDLEKSGIRSKKCLNEDFSFKKEYEFTDKNKSTIMEIDRCHSFGNKIATCNYFPVISQGCMPEHKLNYFQQLENVTAITDTDKLQQEKTKNPEIIKKYKYFDIATNEGIYKNLESITNGDDDILRQNSKTILPRNDTDIIESKLELTCSEESMLKAVNLLRNLDCHSLDVDLFKTFLSVVNQKTDSFDLDDLENDRSK